MPHSPPSRREFLAGLTGAGSALAVAAQAPAAGSGKAVAWKPICIQVFSKPLEWLSYDEAAALTAEAGFDGIEFTVRPGGHVQPERVEADLPRAVAAARQAGLRVETIVTAIVGASEPHTEKILRTTAKLGIGIYRLGNFNYDPRLSVWDSLQQLKPTLRELAAINRQHGLHGAYQNHAGARVGGPLWDLHELLREIDPRWLGCQYDIRHATVEGGLTWPLGFKLLHPWIKCTALKDFIWAKSGGRVTSPLVPLGEGFVNFDEYFKLVRELKVDGPISMHLEYPPFVQQSGSPAERRANFLVAMKKDLHALRGFMARHELR